MSLSFTVYSQRGSGEQMRVDTWDRACGQAVVGSMTQQTAWVIDVFATSRTAARRFGGSAAERRFDGLADHTKVFERIEIRADTLGGGY